MNPHPFDLQARAGLAAHSLTQLLDPQRAGLMYFLGAWQGKPPRAVHGLWDYGDGSGRHIDALTLARRMLPAGSPYAAPDPGEAQLEGWMMRLLGQEGLSWLPKEPWASPWGAEMLLHGEPGNEPLAEISWAQRGTLLGLTSRYQATRDERYLTAGRRLVDGLLGLAERHPDGLFFPEGYYRSGGWRFLQPGLYPGLEEVNAAALVPAVRFYSATGYEPALELAQGLAAFTLKHTSGYLPDGRLGRATHGGLLDHFHTRSNFILGVLELGILTGDGELVGWARRSYEYARQWGTGFGWFPEGLGGRHGEICGTADMIEIALQLGRFVDPAYYAEAERFGRNHLLESQYVSLEDLRQAIDMLPEEPAPAQDESSFSTTDRVTESQVGGFAARSTLNDAFHLDATAMMQCCNAAGTRAFYDLWRYAVDSSPAAAGQPAQHRLHLRFSVETPALRAVSHEPARGQLDILPKQDIRLSLRLPQGEKRATLIAWPGREARVIEAVEDYITFDAIAGLRVEVHYPLAEHAAHYRVGSPGRFLECTGFWRGETLMRVEPPGIYLPLYQRTADLPPAQPSLPAGPLIESLARPSRM